MRQIALDTETTGLYPKDGHRIIEIACVEMIDRRFTQNRFHCYINPERPVDEGAFKVHGLSTDFLADKPTFQDIVEELLQFIQGAELIIHNAPFDIGFLNAELALLNDPSGKMADYCTVTDTLKLSRQLNPGGKHSLDALCKRYGIDNSERELHGALIDATLLGRVYLAMTSGQTTLFGDEMSSNEIQQAAQANTHRQSIERPPLKILRANATEVAAHENYFERREA